MKSLMFILMLTIHLSASGYTFSNEELASMREGLQQWRALARDHKKLSREDAIKELGIGVYKTSLTSIYVLDERIEVRRELQSALISIPGHAEYHANRIKSLRDQYDALGEETASDQNEKHRLKHELLREQPHVFGILKNLPSPETIRVLGEFLTDERGRTIIDPNGPGGPLGQLDASQQRPNSVYAAQTLAGMPIKNKPHAPPIFPDDNQIPHEWINWYTQIKEGRRTFSFEGDPNEYDLNGPVREAKNPDIPRATKRPGPAPQEQGSDKPPTPPTSRTPWIAAVLAAIASLTGWLLLKKRKIT